MEPLASINDTTSQVKEECLDLESEALRRPEKTSELQKRSILDFPVEVWFLILSFLPDKEHVRAAVHSSPRLLALWNADRVQVISDMLEITPGVLEEAACAASFPIAPRFDNTEDENERRLQADGNLRNTPFPMNLCISTKLALSFTGNRNRCLASGCGFQDVSRLEKLHPAVRKLADIYIEQCAASNPALSGTLQERRVTLDERVRIEKAFYRFELFRRAFGSFEGCWAQEAFHGYFLHDDTKRDPDWLDDPVPVLIQEFKDSFNTVELIQLHCIYGFLKRLVTPVINDLLWHNCALDERSLVRHWATDDRVSVHVFAGIQNVYNIWSAFKGRRLYQMCHSIQLENFRSLKYRIVRQHDTIFYHVLSAELYTGLESSLEVTKSKIAVHDVDEGPRDACLAVASSIQAMGRQSSGGLRHELDGRGPHRQWGFVMWDRRRLDVMGFFKQHYASPKLRSPFLSDDLTATSAMFDQHQSSLQQSILPYWRFGWAVDPDMGFEWVGRCGPAYALWPRQYNTWYPLAAPEHEGVLQAA